MSSTTESHLESNEKNEDVKMASPATACKYEKFPFQLGQDFSRLKNEPSGKLYSQNNVFIGLFRCFERDFLGCSNLSCPNHRQVGGFAACGLLIEEKRE